VADNYQSEIRVGEPIVPPRKSYSGLFATLAVLVVLAAAATFVWINYDALADGSHRWFAGSAPTAADDTSGLAQEFHTFQQQTTEALGSTKQLLDAQQGQLAALSSQIADLTAKLERMQPVAVAPQPPAQTQAQPQPSPPSPVPQATGPARARVVALRLMMLSTIKANTIQFSTLNQAENRG
jgi:hypothetical protein